jgi:uncharacterized caspase-like protein
VLRKASTKMLLAVALVAYVSLGTDAARAERRVALVIGNGAYTSITRLANPTTDASEMAKALRSLGFEVLVLLDARKVDIEGAIRQFRDLAAGADVGLFFYSGHGLQTNREAQHHPVNHLVPIDFRIPTGPALDGTVPLDIILKTLEQNVRVSLVFMDACRVSRQLEEASQRFGSQGRAVNLERGFVPVRISPETKRRAGADDGRPAGMLIAYAAAPGSVALDGQGSLSPFTKALLKHIQRAGLPITDIMGQVAQDVWRDTDSQQRPWYVSELSAPFILQRPSRPAILP